MFRQIVSSFKVRAQEDEEIVDPKQVLTEKCADNDRAQNLLAKYTECNDRVNSRKHTTEQCSEELWDYLHVIDECVAKDLFRKLK